MPPFLRSSSLSSLRCAHWPGPWAECLLPPSLTLPVRRPLPQPAPGAPPAPQRPQPRDGPAGGLHPQPADFTRLLGTGRRSTHTPPGPGSALPTRSLGAPTRPASRPAASPPAQQPAPSPGLSSLASRPSRRLPLADVSAGRQCAAAARARVTSGSPSQARRRFFRPRPRMSRTEKRPLDPSRSLAAPDARRTRPERGPFTR